MRWGPAVCLLAMGALGGVVARWLLLPMPFLLGSLFTTSVAVVLLAGRSTLKIHFPQQLRFVFVAIVGALIGASFEPEILRDLARLVPSMIAVVLFVVVAHGFSYAVMRRYGRYDKQTALFAAMPGGLIEAISLGERAGGDIQVLTVQHFARIVIVVTIVPLLFLAWFGQSVGSAAGQTLAITPETAADVIGFLAIAAAGLGLGHLTRLPASHLMGPLLISAALHGMGAIDLTSPSWLLDLSQLVIGTGLGALFAGADQRLLLRALPLSLATVGGMLIISLVFAAALHQLAGMPIEVLFISFAPGGVTEMGLIALSLQVSPTIVVGHHLFRIMMAVALVGVISRFFGVSKGKRPGQG